ncbi:MAG: hypothetical protein WAS72_03065 [Saprospiraceae bacterium]
MAIATDKIYSKENVDEISFQFWMKKLIFEREVLQEEAMNIDFEDDEYIDIAFLPKGTLFFVSDPLIETKVNIKRNSFEGKSGFFVADETSMTFQATYYENYWLSIKQLEHNGEIQELKKGERNEFNIQYSDGFGLVTNSISNIIGQKFFEIEPNQTFHRYRITDEKIDIKDIAIDKTNWFERLNELIAREKLAKAKSNQQIQDQNKNRKTLNDEQLSSQKPEKTFLDRLKFWK